MGLELLFCNMVYGFIKFFISSTGTFSTPSSHKKTWVRYPILPPHLLHCMDAFGVHSGISLQVSAHITIRNTNIYKNSFFISGHITACLLSETVITKCIIILHATAHSD
jgi:hypothetical protein